MSHSLKLCPTAVHHIPMSLFVSLILSLRVTHFILEFNAVLQSPTLCLPELNFVSHCFRESQIVSHSPSVAHLFSRISHSRVLHLPPKRHRLYHRVSQCVPELDNDSQRLKVCSRDWQCVPQSCIVSQSCKCCPEVSHCVLEFYIVPQNLIFYPRISHYDLESKIIPQSLPVCPRILHCTHGSPLISRVSNYSQSFILRSRVSNCVLESQNASYGIKLCPRVTHCV